MASFFDDFFLSGDQKTKLRVRQCLPDGVPKGVVQIAHGIAEHVERYDDFAAFLSENGFVVVANDHLGHGKSIGEPAAQGFFAGEGGWELAVGDMRCLYERTHADFPELPYFLFGHSMGSFLTRTYLIRYRDGLSGAVLSGTGQQLAAVAAAGLLMARREVKKHGAQYRSEALNKMAFGNYTKDIRPLRTAFDWLSRDGAVVDRYIEDPLCGFIPTAGLFRDMMHGIAFNQNKKNLSRMNKQLPVYFMSGDRDPVGAAGKGVMKAYQSFLNAGMSDVTLKLYSGGRHEMLNETNRAEVFSDVLQWLESKLPQAL